MIQTLYEVANTFIKEPKHLFKQLIHLTIFQIYLRTDKLNEILELCKRYVKIVFSEDMVKHVCNIFCECI